MTNARVVILFLGTLALVSLGGIIYLTSVDHGIPDILVATVSGSLSALGAILAKTSSDSGVNVETAQNVNANPDERGAVDAVTVLVVAVLVVLLIVLLRFLV